MPNLAKWTKQLSRGVARPPLQLSSHIFPFLRGSFLSPRALCRAYGHWAQCPPFSGETDLAKKSSLCFPCGFSPGPIFHYHQQKLSHARQLLLPAIFSTATEIKVVHNLSHLSGQSRTSLSLQGLYFLMPNQ